MTQSNAVQPAITFLNMTGDITISWDKSNESDILKMVEAKMAEGMSFFIVKPRIFSFLGNSKVRAQTIAEIKQAGSAVVPDAEFKKMMGRLHLHDPQVEAAVAGGHASLTKSDTPVDREPPRRAKSAQEVVSNQTIAVRRIVGG